MLENNTQIKKENVIQIKNHQHFNLRCREVKIKKSNTNKRKLKKKQRKQKIKYSCQYSKKNINIKNRRGSKNKKVKLNNKKSKNEYEHTAILESEVKQKLIEKKKKEEQKLKKANNKKKSYKLSEKINYKKVQNKFKKTEDESYIESKEIIENISNISEHYDSNYENYDKNSHTFFYNQPKSKIKDLKQNEYKKITMHKDLKKIINNSQIPEDLYTLPCREYEQKVIYEFIRAGLHALGSYYELYISGMPGTGKTESITQTINKMKFKSHQKKLPAFNYIYINGMKLKNANLVYKQIYYSIFKPSTTKSGQIGKELTYIKCCRELNDFFQDRNSANFENLADLESSFSHILIVVDEVDMLINKKQNHLYNIFNWTSYPNSRLIVISISNTLDLPDRLNQKVKSRSGNNRLVFKPYNYEQLLTIFKKKINGFEKFQEDALNICCKKVAALNGDLRRILQLCNMSLQIFKKRKDLKMIDARIVLESWNRLFESKIVFLLSELKFYERLILFSFIYEIKQSGLAKCCVLQLYEKIKIFSERFGNDGFYKIEIVFEEFKIIVLNLIRLDVMEFCDQNLNFVKASLSIKFYPEEFINAMNRDECWSAIVKEYLDNCEEF